MQTDTLLTQNIAHADPCGRNIENNYVKQYSRALSLQLTEWSSISAGTRRLALAQKERARRAAETVDQRNERLRNWGWGTVPNALLKLLVKDKPLYSGKVRERRETKPLRREERHERQTGSEKLRGERLKIIYYSRRGPTRGEITLQLRSTNQRKWLAVETPEERGLRLEC